jgi:hypothetical protein
MLAEWLRTLDIAAAHVQTLTCPVLETPAKASPGRTGIFALLPERVSSPAAPDGCDPAVFAEQCAAYLERAAAERGPVEEDGGGPQRVVAPLVEPDETRSARRRNDRGDGDGASEVPVSEPPRRRPLRRSRTHRDRPVGDARRKSVPAAEQAIETVSRDSARAAAPGTRTGEVWTPSSLGSAAVWPAMDFASNAHQNHASSSASTRSPLKRFPGTQTNPRRVGLFRSGAVRLLGAARQTRGKSLT